MDSKNGKQPYASVQSSKRLKLQTHQSDSGDERNAVENQCSINDLPVECIQKIISFLPGRQWPRLELVNRKFQSGVLASWRCLKEVHLVEYSEKRLVEWNEDENAARQSLLSILRMIQIRSPTVQTIDGFESFSWRLDSDIMVEVAKFEMLSTVTFVDCGFLIRHLDTFLANSRSRAVLAKLYLKSTVLSQSEWNYEINAHITAVGEETIRRALINVEGRPGLRLKTFYCVPKNRCYPTNLLHALDVSQLESVSITDHQFKASAVGALLRRCTQLKELAMDVSPGLDGLVEIISTLKALTSPNLRKLEFYTRSRYEDEVIVETLREVAQRCPKVEVLNIDGNSSDEILHVIGECFSHLKELTLNVLSVSKEAFAGLLIRAGQLKKLGLRSFNNRLGASIVTMAMNTNNLTSLHLDFGAGIRFGTWENALSKLDLERVTAKELSVKFKFVEEETVAICQRLGPMMVSVDFSRSTVNDELFQAAIGNKVMRQVRRISLKLTSITDRSLHAIGDSCPLLKELDIYGCMGVTANGIRGMIEKCKKLTRLKVSREIPGLRDLIRDSMVTIETYSL